jgi:hypothetical protein
VSDLIVENLCDTKYPYRPTPILVSDEAHTIESSVPYSISLKEKPSPDHDIIIPGYTEQDSAPSEATYFYVDYSASLIYFFSSEASESITVTYFGMGSPIIAGDVNRFSLFLDNMKSALFSFLVEALSVLQEIRLIPKKNCLSILARTEIMNSDRLQQATQKKC